MIGDCLLITPAIDLLKKKYPEAKITVLCRPYTKEIFLGNKNVDEVIEDWFALNKIGSINNFRRYIDLIRSKNFDCSIHFYNELPYALLARFAGIKQRVGDISKPLLAPFYNLRGDCKWGDLTLHEIEHNILLLKPLGIELPQTPPPMSLTPKKEIVDKFISEYNIGPSDFVLGIHVGTGRGNKAWLPERYAKVIDHLYEKYNNIKMILTGSKNEAQAVRQILRICKNKPIDLVERTTLSELIAIISRYNIYLGVDTGPLHIAAALDVPTVALFPTKFVKPTEWGPWQTPHIIIRKAVNCSQKCRPLNCPFDDCLKEISAEEVLDAISNLIESKGNNTLAESRADWFKKSVNIFTNKEEILRELTLNGYHVVDIGLATSIPKLYNQLIKEDINIIHFVGLNMPYTINIAKILATPSLSIPPLLINERTRYDYSTNSLIELYKRRFQ